MKKAIVLAVCLLLVGLLAVNGTLAQGLSDLFADLSHLFTGGAPQQDTKGELDVRLVYQKRNADGTALVGEGTPEQLAPARYSEFDWENDKKNVGNVQLWDDSKIIGAVDKFTSVSNEGEKSAYIRTAFALDKYAYDNGIIHLNFNYDEENFHYEYKEKEWKPITIKGREYVMQVVTCKKELIKDYTTPPMLLQVAMSRDVTNADLSNISADFLLIKTMAIESDVFVDEEGNKLSAEAALNLALPLNNLQPFQ